MTVQQTSIAAYYGEDQIKLGHDEFVVLKAILEHPRYTDRMLTCQVKADDPNKVRPRRNSLVHYGYVRSDGKRECLVSHKIVYCWLITEEGRDVLFRYERRHGAL